MQIQRTATAYVTVWLRIYVHTACGLVLCHKTSHDVCIVSLCAHTNKGESDIIAVSVYAYCKYLLCRLNTWCDATRTSLKTEQEKYEVLCKNSAESSVWSPCGTVAVIQRPRLWVVESVSVLLWKDLVPAIIEILIDGTRQQLLCEGEASVEMFSSITRKSDRNTQPQYSSKSAGA